MDVYTQYDQTLAGDRIREEFNSAGSDYEV